MRQLKKEYQLLKAAKAAAAADECSVDSENDEEEDIQEYDDPHHSDTESEAEELTAALDGLCIRGPEAESKVLLRGVPVAKVYHFLFSMPLPRYTMFLVSEYRLLTRNVLILESGQSLSWHTGPFAGWTPTVRGR